MNEEHTQYLQEINVWLWIAEDQVIGPFFINENNYLEMLQKKVPTLAN